MEIRRLRPVAAAVPIVAWAMVACAVACAPRAERRPGPTTRSFEAEFVAPPDLTTAHRLPSGSVQVGGRAPGGALVSLASPDGRRLVTVADAQGAWTLVLAPAARPELFAVSATIGARLVRADGALVVAPAPAEPAYLARTGAASMPVFGPARLRLIAFDYDPGGGAGVAGVAAPGARVELAIDGVPSGAGRSDAHGRFSLLAVRAPLAPGPHVVSVRTADGSADLALRITPAASLGRAPVRVSTQPGAWRIDWAPPGGGVQTTLALTPPAGA